MPARGGGVFPPTPGDHRVALLTQETGAKEADLDRLGLTLAQQTVRSPDGGVP